MDASPSIEHRRLHALIGAWRGEEEMCETQWAPAGAADADILAEATVGGRFVSLRYRQTRGGHVSFRSHSIFGFDDSDGLTKMFQFDSTGFFPASPAAGSWNGDALVLERASPRGAARVSYFFESSDCYRTRLEFRPAGSEAWQAMTTGMFRRVPSSSINLA
jgi:hypothetical protein